jgi:hypothetical protein
MSRDKSGNGIQGVVGSIPISSTNSISDLANPSGSAFCCNHTFGHNSESASSA